MARHCFEHISSRIHFCFDLVSIDEICRDIFYAVDYLLVLMFNQSK